VDGSETFWSNCDMAGGVKIASELPADVHALYDELPHGQKQLACAAGFLLYFEADEETRWLYREWAKAINEGRANSRTPPETIRKMLQERRAKRTKK
jgi:hypothetical protein